MRYCTNCGAQLEENVTMCPYCGAENSLDALREHVEQLNQIHEQTEEVRDLKERIARRATRVTGYVAAGVVVFFALLFVLTLVYSRVRAATALNRQNRDLEQLEALYEAGQYEEMGEYLEGIPNSYAATFQKYYRVDQVCNSLESNRTYSADIFDFMQRDPRGAEFVPSVLYFDFSQIERMETFREEGYPFGEEEGIEYVRSQYDEILKPFRITEEEYDAAIRMIREGKEEEDFAEMGRTIYERITAGE